MAVLSINKRSGRSGDEGAMRYEHHYFAVLDDAATPDNEIFGHPDLPQYLDPHPLFGWLFVRNRKLSVPTEDEDRRTIVEVIIEYEQLVVDDDVLETVLASANPALLTQPELRLPTKSWRTAEVIRPLRAHIGRDGEVVNRSNAVVDTFIAGSLITNTARIPPDTPPQYRAFNRVFTLTRYEASYDESLSDNYLGRANSTTFKGKPEYTVLCTLIDAENKYVTADGGGGSRELALVTYQFEYDANGQWEDIPNVSLEQLNAAGDDWEKIVDENGDPIQHPVPIDIDGRKVDADGLPSGELVIRTYPYLEADFNELGF